MKSLPEVQRVPCTEEEMTKRARESAVISQEVDSLTMRLDGLVQLLDDRLPGGL